MKLLLTSKRNINGDNNGEFAPNLENTDVLLVRFNIFSDGYPQDSKVLFTFVPKKPFGKLINICPIILILLKTFNADFFIFKY